MATASQIISRAMRLIGVLDPRQALNAEEAQNALDTLNGMLAEWHEAEIGLPDYSFSSLTNPLSTDAADVDAIAYALGIRLAPEYGVSLSAEYAGTSEQAMGRLRLRYFEQGVSDYSELPSPQYDFNSVTGE